MFVCICLHHYLPPWHHIRPGGVQKGILHIIPIIWGNVANSPQLGRGMYSSWGRFTIAAKNSKRIMFSGSGLEYFLFLPLAWFMNCFIFTSSRSSKTQWWQHNWWHISVTSIQHNGWPRVLGMSFMLWINQSSSSECTNRYESKFKELCPLKIAMFNFISPQ